MHNDELHARRLGIDTYREPVVFMHANCHVCSAEGFRAMSRVRLEHAGRSVIATLDVVLGDIVAAKEAGLSEAAWVALGCNNGDLIRVSHPDPVESFSLVRNKIYGGEFEVGSLQKIVRDINSGNYSSIEIAAFITACAGNRMSLKETIALTKAMVDAGTRLTWHQNPVMDKHCVGGLPGNRTTPIVVPIVAACGLTIPKTSSRAITSPAGTADTMEVLAPVDLTLEHMRRVVEREGGCIVWGGAMALSPADDVLIQVERPLDFDSLGQLTASVLSKKLAAGSTNLLIDIPVGPTAKLRNTSAAAELETSMLAVSMAFGLQVRVVRTDGSQPVGNGIGPALEALDVLAVLQNHQEAPQDLRERALLLSGHLLEMGGKAAAGAGIRKAREVLASGAAWKKFVAICEAQGGLRQPSCAQHKRTITATSTGTISSIDNRRLARLAKLAGAPMASAAGIELKVCLEQHVEQGQSLYVIHAEAIGSLEYASGYATVHPDIIFIERQV